MIPVIMSGGVGTRLWPISRTNYPKQFCDLLDESLILKTYKRLEPLGAPYVLTTTSLELLTNQALEGCSSYNTDHVIYEPSSNNTAPAIALLCRQFELTGMEHEIVGVFPADHLIEEEHLFVESVRMAEKAALSSKIVTLGIEPTYPATGFGYIEVEGMVSGSLASAHSVVSFHEKPDLGAAKEYLNTKRYLWNAGIFVFQVKKMIESFRSHAPEIWSHFEKIKRVENLPDAYRELLNVSIDFAIMEREEEQKCIPCQFSWSDLGSWDDFAEQQEWGSSKRPVFNIGDSAGNYVHGSSKKLVAFVDTSDMIIVDTDEALLILKKGSSQKIKSLVNDLKKAKPSSLLQESFEVRPWGNFQVLNDTEQFKTKLITVEPGHQLSYQSHEHREEFWVVISGQATVVLEGEVHILGENESISIPKQAKHRMKNASNKPMSFFEIQVGSYFGEDDIVRYEDDYKRKPS